MMKASEKLSKMVKFNIKKEHMLYAILLLIAISSVALVQWNILKIQDYETTAKKQDAFRELGIWTDKNIDNESIIMTVLPMDINFYTGKRTVMDPFNYALNMGADNIELYENRSIEEIKYYNVTHVLLHTDDQSALSGFKFLNLDLIYQDAADDVYLYSIIS